MYKDLDEAQMITKTKELRTKILQMLCEAGSGHSGGSLSSIDILTVLYYKIMNHDPKNPKDGARDRFVLSKGHVCPALYAVLADCGYFDESHLMTLRKYGSILQGHPYMHKTPGLDISSGSLGQGLSVAVGMALAVKMDKGSQRVYSLMGDGEQQEGQIWEAAMSAGHYRLDNLCGVVDQNRLQIDGNVENVMNIEPLVEKWEAFNWNVIRVDGHDVTAIEEAFRKAEAFKGKPSVIIAETVKGKGVSFMENKCNWHGATPNKEQLACAICELEY
jgi:transketolase